MTKSQEILKEVWDKLPYVYFDKHPDEAIREFLRLVKEVKDSQGFSQA